MSELRDAGYGLIAVPTPCDPAPEGQSRRTVRSALVSARRIGCESRNNDSNVQYGYVCRLSALSVSRRLGRRVLKHRIHPGRGRDVVVRGRHSVQATAGPAGSAAEYTGQVPPEEGGAHHTPRVPPREGRGSLLGSRAAAACKCSLRRSDHRTCAPSACKCSPRRQAPPQNLRALPRASSSTSCGHRRRSVASSRSHVPRAPDEMQSDALRCTQMHSDALRCTQMQSRSNVPRAPDERQSDAIRCNQRQSEAIRSHQCQSEAIKSAERAVDVKRSDVISANQCQSEAIRGNQRQSEAIQSAPLTLSDRTEP